MAWSWSEFVNPCNPSAAVEFSELGSLRVFGIPCKRHGVDCSKTATQQYVLIATDDSGDEWTRVMSWEEVSGGKNFQRLPSSSQCCRATISTSDPLMFENGLKVPLSSVHSTSIDDQMARMSLVDHRRSSAKSQFDVSVVRSTYSTARIEWTPGLQGLYEDPNQWMIVITRINYTSEVAYFHVKGSHWYFDLPVRLTGGAEYKVEVKALRKIEATDSYSYVVIEGSVQFRADMTEKDLEQLYEKAKVFTGLWTDYGDGLQFAAVPRTPCNWFYRNKPDSYFDDIIKRRGGIMVVYKKDPSGDPASTINGKLDGLFFMAKNENGSPPTESVFGSTRLQVPAEVMLNKAPNLYFADFYCMRGRTHYVTLVITTPYSEANEFCKKHLLPLNINENPFLFRCGYKLYTVDQQLLNVEVFYTENINIYEILKEGSVIFSGCPTPNGCKGYSSPSGIPKNSSCKLCNIRLPTNSEFSIL